jgi:membrane-bound serine protease (ClpP class)
LRRLAIILLTAAAALALSPSGAQAKQRYADQPAQAPVDVVQVSGLVDEILVDEITQSIERASTNGAQALVLQMNTGGAVVSRDRMTTLLERIARSPVPIGIWVGPSGASVMGLPMQLLAAADVTAMAPGASIGQFGTPLQVKGVEIDFGAATDLLRSGTMGFQQARTLGALKLTTTDEGVPAVKNMVLAMDGLIARGKTLDTV